MQLEPTLTFRGIEPTPEIEADIRERIGRLETYYHAIMGCRVLVEFVQRHHEAGNRYHVRIDLTVPGEEIVVAHEGGLHRTAKDAGAARETKQDESDRERKHAHVAVRQAFDVMRRRLQDFARRQRGQVKTTARLPHGRIVRLAAEEGYGFIQAEDGHEVYFQASSVLKGAFDRLEVGTEVAFAEEAGDKGPQASTVKVARAKRARAVPVGAAMAVVLFLLATALSFAGQPPRHRAAPPTTKGTFVFVGGYYYDPFFGPYPWWPRYAYPHLYYPSFDATAYVHVAVKPSRTAVYVDGFYAGTVDDFDDLFQRLPLPPGGHELVFYLAGHRTVRDNVYLAPGSTFDVRETLQPVAAGERSEPPAVVRPVPPPRTGTFRLPKTPGASLPPGEPTDAGTVQGTLVLRVQPAGAEVTIDDRRWASSDGEHFSLDLAVGAHRLTVSKPGYLPYSSTIQVSSDEATPLNVNLTAGKP